MEQVNRMLYARKNLPLCLEDKAEAPENQMGRINL